MNGILEKLGSYQLLTNLLPGAFFGMLIKFFFDLSLSTTNIGEDVMVYYFMGLIINRIGSLVVEPFLKKIRFIKYTSHADFAKATKIDSKIDTLSEMNNYYRSLLTVVLLLPLLRIIQILFQKWNWLSNNWTWGAIAVLIILFLLSYKKQTTYVSNRVDVVNNK